MKFSFLFLFLSLLISPIFGTAPDGLFKKYPNPAFVETGTYLGNGILQAVNAGFQEIHSIELDQKLYYDAKKRFSPYKKVKIYFGDSSILLKSIISKINKPITFWLDGHYSGPGTALGKNSTPILDELEQIMKHPIKTHTIIIDDLRIFDTAEFDYVSKNALIEKLLKINPNYKITYENGYVVNDILVAHI